MKIYKKNANNRLSKNFHQSEFDCQCTDERCFITIIQESVIESLEKVRADYGLPIYISSGNRCILRNSDPFINGAKESTHVYGAGVDIVSFDGNIEKLEKITRKYFSYVKRYKKHIHADNRLLKE